MNKKRALVNLYRDIVLVTVYAFSVRYCLPTYKIMIQIGAFLAHPHDLKKVRYWLDC